MSRRNRIFIFIFVLTWVALISCNLSISMDSEATQVVPTTGVPEVAAPSPTVVMATVTNPPVIPTDTQAALATLPPTATTPAQPTATAGPTCTVLQDLNLRSGPGTAYRPPIRALPAQTELTPLGYNPSGVSGGAWVQVQDKTSNQIGWVSAGNQFVSCNIDLATLPSVAVAPPPPPPPPQSNNSTPDGTFPESFVWEADFNSQYFVRFRVHDTSNGGSKDGEGIKEVNFQVLDGSGKSVYQRTERQAGFCIFGGGEPTCNPWVLEDFIYKWNAGGEAVKEGDYKLLIVVVAENETQGNWNYDVTIDLPN